MAAKHSTLRSALLPRRAVLRVALTVMVTLVVGLAPGLAHNRAAAVSPYEGYLNFANQTNTTLWIAISYLDQGHCGTDGWVASGWWGVDPGEITAPLRLAHNDSTHFYYYAFGEDGTTLFKGTTTTYVDRNDKFIWCDPAGGSRPDLASVDMKEIVIDSQPTSFTVRLGRDRYVSLEDESSRSGPFEPADNPVPDERGCTISGGQGGCPASD